MVDGRYGLTPKSFFSGEFCSTMWVYGGGVFAAKPAMLWPIDGADVPPLALVAFAVAVFGVVCANSPPGRLWQKEYRARVASKAKAC